MTQTWIRGSVIACVVVLGVVGGVFTFFNGTFWGKASAEKQMDALLQQDYGQLKFRQIGSAMYNFKSSSYDEAVIFDDLPSVKYYFELRGGKLMNEGSSSLGPTPVPHSTSWIYQDVRFAPPVMNKIQTQMKKGTIPPNTYMMTGGIGMKFTNALSVNPQGNMTILTPGTGIAFTLNQHVNNPAQWRVLSHSQTSVNVQESSGNLGTAVPWVKKQTRYGETYYEWDVYPGQTWFYFDKNGNYIWLRVVSPGLKRYPFPDNIIRDMLLVSG